MNANSGMTRRSLLSGAGGLFISTSFAVAEGLPKATVTKDPNCGCCSGWVEHLKQAGFPVDITEASDLNRVKVRLGVPHELAACHTAEIDGYVIEGHVPAQAIKRLLGERPHAKGLAVPGMPTGSPGMEVEGSEPEVYSVILFGPAGQRTFARFRGVVDLSSHD